MIGEKISFFIGTLQKHFDRNSLTNKKIIFHAYNATLSIKLLNRVKQECWVKEERYMVD